MNFLLEMLFVILIFVVAMLFDWWRTTTLRWSLFLKVVFVWVIVSAGFDLAFGRF